jgi:hypothetical protein
MDTYPQLFSFVRKKSCSINQFLIWDDCRSFFLPLSQIASDQLAALKADVQGLNLDLVSDDIWYYSWGSNTFSSHKAYISIQGSYPAVGVLDRQSTKGSTRGRRMWPRRDR